MSRAGRAWLTVFAVAAGATATALGVVAAVERARPELARAPAFPFHPLALRRVDAHLRGDASALEQAVELSAGQGIRGLLNLAGGWWGGELERQLGAAARYQGRVRVLMNLDGAGCCDAQWAARETARLEAGRAAGAAGLALAGRETDREVLDDPALAPIWETCVRLGLPVSLRVEQPGRWEAVALLAARHPQLTIAVADFGPEPSLVEIAALLDRHPGLHLDLAGRLTDLAGRPAEWRALLLARPDRFLFGSNVRLSGAAPDVIVHGAGSSPEEVRAFYRLRYRILESRDPSIPLGDGASGAGLGLPSAALERLYRANAERIFGFSLGGE